MKNTVTNVMVTELYSQELRMEHIRAAWMQHAVQADLRILSFHASLCPDRANDLGNPRKKDSQR